MKMYMDSTTDISDEIEGTGFFKGRWNCQFHLLSSMTGKLKLDWNGQAVSFLASR